MHWVVFYVQRTDRYASWKLVSNVTLYAHLVNAPVSGHHSTASLTLGSIGMQGFSALRQDLIKNQILQPPSFESDRHCSMGAGVNETRWLAQKILREADVDQFLSSLICIQLWRTNGVDLISLCADIRRHIAKMVMYCVCENILCMYFSILRWTARFQLFKLSCIYTW